MSFMRLTRIDGQNGACLTRSRPAPTFREKGVLGAIKEALDYRCQNAEIARNCHLSRDHQWVFVDWGEGLALDVIRPGGILIDVDHHFDMHFPAVSLPQGLIHLTGASAEKIVELASGYILDLTHEDRLPEGSFIMPALALGWFDTIYKVNLEGQYREEEKIVCLQRPDGIVAGPLVEREDAVERRTVNIIHVNINEFASVFERGAKTVTFNLDLDFFCEAREKSARLFRAKEVGEKIVAPAAPELTTAAVSPSYWSHNGDSAAILKELLWYCLKPDGAKTGNWQLSIPFV